MLEQGGNVDVAMGLAQTARRGMPDSPNAADTLGWAYYQKGVYQSAISQFQEALRLAEKRGEPDRRRSSTTTSASPIRRPTRMRWPCSNWKKPLSSSPKNADAKKALSELRS